MDLDLAFGLAGAQPTSRLGFRARSAGRPGRGRPRRARTPWRRAGRQRFLTHRDTKTRVVKAYGKPHQSCRDRICEMSGRLGMREPGGLLSSQFRGASRVGAPVSARSGRQVEATASHVGGTARSPAMSDPRSGFPLACRQRSGRLARVPHIRRTRFAASSVRFVTGRKPIRPARCS